MALAAPPRRRPGARPAGATRGQRRQALVLPALVAVVALVGGILLLVLPQDRPAPRSIAPTPAPSVAAVTVPTTRVAAATGAYSVAVPRGMRARREGATTRLVEKSRRFTATIAPVATRDPALANARVLRAMKKGYRSVTITSHGLLRVDGRRAVASYGVAVTEKGDRIGYAVVSVRGATRSWTISSFATAATEPATVLPRIRAIVSGFHLRR